MKEIQDKKINSFLDELIDYLRILERIYRKFHPMMISRYREVLEGEGLRLSRAEDGVSTDLSLFRNNSEIEPLLKASGFIQQAAGLFRESDQPAEIILNVMKAARKVSKAKEILFGLRHEIRKIDDFFHEAPCERVNTHVASGDMLVHEYKGDDPYSRSGYSLYVPDRTADNEIRPLIVSLHGGYGHGRDNIWTWIREARSRRLFLLCPTSTDLTWDISGRGEDASMLEEKVNMILSNYPVDRSRVLLSGFSDGATYSFRFAMLPETVFSGFNPVSGVLPPGNLAFVKGRRIFWIHGKYDWMFSLDRAKKGCEDLLGSGADVRLKIIDDLAHAYPVEENASVLDWFSGGLGDDLDK